ncbi:MAG: type IA DNA topoisomerase [Sphaerochaetaceae bacterium]
MENSNKKSLIIVESPTKARTIKKFLPKNYTVLASNGHVRDLPSKDLSIDVEKGYIPKYVISKGKDKIIKELKSELAKSDNLLLATDEDREGESIAHHLVEILKPKVPYERMVFHEITKSAILNALENGRPIRDNLVNAQEARRVLDRLYGYTLSPFLWRKLSLQKLSAGRVQSPGLRMVVERERQRIDFVSAQYWDLKADLLKGSKL